MTTPIQSCVKIAKSEKPISFELDQIQIVDVATGVILKPKAEFTPPKKITTILHRLPSPKVDVSQTDASLFNDKAFEAYLKKHDLRYNPRTRLFSRGGRCVPSFESTILMHEFEMERRKPETFSLKHFMDFEAHLVSLKNKGWEISKDGGFGVNLMGDVVPLSDLEDDFDVEQMKFRRFLDEKGLSYDSKADVLLRKGEVISVAEACALVKEFQNPKGFTESVKSKLGSNQISMPKELRKINPESIEQWKESEGRKKITLSFYNEFDAYLDALQLFSGWEIYGDGSGKAPSGKMHPASVLQAGYINNREGFDCVMNEEGVHYDRNSGLLASLDRILTVDESFRILNKFKVKRSLKGKLQYEVHLDFLRMMGWEIYPDGTWKDPEGIKWSDEAISNNFLANQAMFLTFLDREKLTYDPSTGLLATKDRVLSPDESLKKVEQHEAECSNRTPDVKVDVVAKKSLKIENQPPMRELMPDSAKLRSSKDGGVKFSLKALLQYEYYLDHLQMKGVKGTEQEFLGIQATFKAFLESKGLHYDSNSGLLASKEGLLNGSEIYNLIGEFESGRDDGPVSKSKSRKKPATPVEIPAEEQKTKQILKAMFDFESYLEMLEKDGWQVNRDGKFATDPKGQTIVFSGLEEKFKGTKEYFRIYLEENKLQYDPNSGWIAGQDFAKTQEILKAAIREIKVKTTLYYYMEFEGVLDAQRRAGWEVDMEKRISVGPEGHIITFEEAENDFISRKEVFFDYLEKCGVHYDEITKSFKGDVEAVLENYPKEMENRTARLRLILKSYTDFNYNLALLKNEGWQVNGNGGYALNPVGEMNSIATLQEKFRVNKDSFFAFLDEKGLHYDEASGWIANKGRVLSFEQNSALVKENNSKDRVEVKAHLQFMMDFSAQLRDFKKAGWQVNYQGRFVFGPKDELFTFDELEKKRLNMRANFMKYLDSLGYRYDESKNAICMSNTPVSMELSKQVVNQFMNPPEQLPDFQIIKRITLETIEYKDYLESLRKRGWKIENESLTTPEGKTFPIQGLEDKYLNARGALMVAAAGTNLSDFLDSAKDFIVKDFVSKALAEFGMKYNGEKKKFENESFVMTVEEMLMQLSFKRLGLL